MSSNETARLAALRRYRILDTEPEQAFDDLTLLASQILETPIALITLLDDHRQWFKSRVGLSVTETARSIALCAHTIQQRDLFVVPDTLADARFRDNPLVVGEPWVRSYVGAPLVTRLEASACLIAFLGSSLPSSMPRSMLFDVRPLLSWSSD